MSILILILFIAAAVVFLIATLPIPARVNLVALGLLLLTVAFIFEFIPSVHA
jgi:hypothetical protein